MEIEIPPILISLLLKVEESVYAKGPNFSALNQAIIGEPFPSKPSLHPYQSYLLQGHLESRLWNRTIRRWTFSPAEDQLHPKTLSWEKWELCFADPTVFTFQLRCWERVAMERFFKFESWRAMTRGRYLPWRFARLLLQLLRIFCLKIDVNRFWRKQPLFATQKTLHIQR